MMDDLGENTHIGLDPSQYFSISITIFVVKLVANQRIHPLLGTPS